MTTSAVCRAVGSSSGGTGAVPVAERPLRGDMAAALDPKSVWQPAPTGTVSPRKWGHILQTVVDLDLAAEKDAIVSCSKPPDHT